MSVGGGGRGEELDFVVGPQHVSISSKCKLHNYLLTQSKNKPYQHTIKG